MIHYQLKCRQGHGFDGWFPNSAAFDQQAALGLIACPICADVSVSRALMAPAVTRSHKRALAASPPTLPDTADPAPSAPPTSGGPVAIAGERMPDHIRAVLQRLRAEVERNCDYVGPRFAEEARRIHKGDADARGIYGEATPDEAEALADEGVDISRIPWVPQADS